MIDCCVRHPTYEYAVPSWGSRFLKGFHTLWNPLKRLVLWPLSWYRRRRAIRHFSTVALPLVKRTFPSLLAHDFITVQPMCGPDAPQFHKTYRTRRKHQWFLEDALFHGTKYSQHIYVDFSKRINEKCG